MYPTVFNVIVLWTFISTVSDTRIVQILLHYVCKHLIYLCLWLKTLVDSQS